MNSSVDGKPGRLRLLMAGVQWPPETFLRRLINELLEAGVEVTVGCTEEPDFHHPHFRWLSMPVWEGKAPLRFWRLAGLAARAMICGPGDVQRLRRSFRTGPTFGDGLARWIRVLPLTGRRWDVVYFPWNIPAIIHLAAFDLPSPVVLSCRGAQVNIAPYNPDRVLVRDGLRATFDRAAAVHCVSEEIKREAVQHGLDPAKVFIIRPAVDPERFRPLNKPRARDGVFRIATTGSLIWRKGYEYALQAVRKLADRGVAVAFDIVGDGPERQRLLYTIHDLDLEKSVTLRGSLQEEAVVQLLQQADAFVLSSLSEGISNAVLEAMACALPVVTTDSGGMGEALTDGVEGFLVPVRDPEAIASALGQLAADAGKAREMGRAGRERVCREFTLKRQVSQWLDLYRTVLNRQVRRGFRGRASDGMLRRRNVGMMTSEGGRKQLSSRWFVQKKEKSEGKIVLVVPTFPKLSETFIANKFLGLLDRGWDIHVVCEASDPMEWERLPQLQQRPELRRRVHPAWPRQPRWLAALLWPPAALSAFMWNAAGAWRHLRAGSRGWGARGLSRFYLDCPIVKLRPDLIHFEFGPLAREQMHLKEILGCKVVTSFRGYDANFSGLEDPNFYEAVWEGSDALHFLGEDLWRRAQRRGCPAEKTHALISPAIEAQSFDPGERRHEERAGTSDRPLRVLSVGRLEWKKGYEHALQAIRLLLDRGVHCQYQIIGAGSYLEAVAFARHQLGVAQHVELLGALPPPEVKEKMRQADVLMHAAVSEGFCNAVLEAQAMMLPVVCSDADGLSENVADGETGFVVPRRDSRSLADKLALLAGRPDLRQQMGQAGRRRVLTHFQLADQISGFDRLYRQVLSQPAPAMEPIASAPTLAEVRTVGSQE